MAQNRKNNYQDNEFVKNNAPFKDDLLGREKVAAIWQDTLLKPNKHFVIGVDASWGMGKTYFARNWECKLLHDGYNVCYIDVFEYDFTDDPFMVLTANIIEAFEFNELEQSANNLSIFLKAFKRNIAEIIPALVGGAVSLMPYVSYVANIVENVTKVTKDSIKDAKNHLSYNTALLGFKEKLQELISKQNNGKPFIIMIDELDRCKPNFAIEFLEKLKHIFDIPNIIFILFINEKELTSAISHMYGVNGDIYLRKFINIKLELKNTYKELTQDKIMNFIEKKFNFENIKIKPTKSGFDKNPNINPVHDLVESLYKGCNLSLRDIINLHMFCEYISNFVEDEYNFAFLIILKTFQITNHEVYSQLIHIENVRVYNNFNSKEKQIILPLFMKYHDGIELNRYIKIFSLFIEKVHSKKDIDVSEYIEEEIRRYYNYKYDDLRRKISLLDYIKEAAESINVKTFHQYISKLLLYINLDIPDIDNMIR